MSMAWEPDRRSNFSSPPAQLCAVTYMTEISLIVTLNNQFNSTQLKILHALKVLPYTTSDLEELARIHGKSAHLANCSQLFKNSF